MTQQHNFKDMLARDELIITFALGRIVHPILIDMFGLAGGYHGFWLDQEHCGVSPQQIITASTAARANGFDSFVRLPPTGYAPVTQCLEAGAGGVMAAQVHSAAEAEEFVSWCKFPPRGTRGLNSGGFDADYTHKSPAEFSAEANEKNFVAIQIETLGALEEVDAIAAIDGVDLVFVGPSDMSMALGIVGQFHSDKLWEAMDRVATAAKNRGKHWGTLPYDPQMAERALEKNCKLLTIGNEIVIMRRGIDAVKEAFGEQFS
jgi:2-dehydro-3-deoxyglucarate aldolase/4-hydroxy-2-oxoheptanedioate aldolase